MRQEYKTPGILAAEVKMSRRSHEGAFLIVEGKDDIRFWRPRSYGKCELVDGEGKPNVVGCIIKLDKEGFRGALGIVDRDYDIFIGRKIDTDNIITTDAHDLECILCRSYALDMVLAEYGNSSKIDKFEQETGRSVRAALLERTMPFGRLRIAALQQPVIDLKQIRVPRFVDRNTWSVRSEELIRQSTNSDLPEEVQELEYRIKRLQPKESWYIVRGHDLIEILRIGLQHVLGDIGSGTGIKEITRSLRLAVRPEDLQETNMWTDIRNWENSNPPYKILPD